MIIQIPTCEHCGSNKYSQMSYNSVEYTIHCYVCGKESKGKFVNKEVDFPTVVFPDGTIEKNLSEEREIFYNESTGYPFGVNVKIYTHDFSNYSDVKVNNITEFHYLFNSLEGAEEVALESDLHWHGGTKPLKTIKFITIIRANEMKESYYD